MKLQEKILPDLVDPFILCIELRFSKNNASKKVRKI